MSGRYSARVLRNTALLVFLSCVLAPAARQFQRPIVQPANTYPAHDAHNDEKVTVAVDPYDLPDKAAIFSVNYKDHDILPINLVISNDGDQPISLTDMKAELVTVGREKLTPQTPDDLYRRLSKPSRNDRPSPLPLPLPRRKMKGSVSKEALAEIRDAQFAAEAVEPHSTRSGFLFFDVRDISTPLAGAAFYLTRVRNNQGGELIYFEIPLEKYLMARPTPH